MIAFAALCLGFSNEAAAQLVVKVRPARPAKVVKCPGPKKGHVWIGGHWTVRGGNYVWVKGRYVQNRPGYRWVPGHWKRCKGGQKWVPGHWRRA